MFLCRNDLENPPAGNRADELSARLPIWEKSLLWFQIMAEQIMTRLGSERGARPASRFIPVAAANPGTLQDIVRAFPRQKVAFHGLKREEQAAGKRNRQGYNGYNS